MEAGPNRRFRVHGYRSRILFLVARELFQVFPGFVAFLELFFVAEILEEDLVVDDGRQIFRANSWTAKSRLGNREAK